MLTDSRFAGGGAVLSTLEHLIGAGADETLAITAPGRAGLNYRALRALVADTLSRLAELGAGRNDRVAIVLPNGPEMASCFLACAAGTASAPLNPAYRADEFEFYLGDLQPKALIVERGSPSPAVAVARKLGVRVVELVVPPDAPAGYFLLEGGAAAPAADAGYGRPDDVAMLLHTSGTTARPKLVPLTVANLCASALNVGATLRLARDDIGLNIMPLFHIHGLVAGVLAPLAAGSQVHCTPGFGIAFFEWMAQARPTWYTAVPTMHQAIVARAKHHQELLRRRPLRFLRSSSAPMSPKIIGELEAAFGAPLIEAYGMTEAAHQIACNPLPPGSRKPGSVGPGAGCEMRIIDDAGAALGMGRTGEIAIRGPSVMRGYEHNAKANAEAFADGWFRTGDQGIMDAEGYVRITGRLKEIINRGGEKVSPREIDEILLNHPAVAQALCFAMPHAQFGEEVAAAVVLAVGCTTTERELKAFAAERIADFKVPKKIVLLEEIPKGATGKLQRIGLAQKLGIG